MKISPEMQKKLQEFQETQQQARLVVNQKYQIELQLREAQNALEELGKTEKAEVYKALGQLLIKTKKEDTVKELKEKTETLELRLKTLESQEKKLTTKLKSLQDRLQGIVTKVGTGG